MKKVIYSLWILLFIFACSDSNDLDYSDLKVTFQKSKIDVGENTQQLDIPVVLTGCKNDIPLDVKATVTATDGTAIAGTDYEIITNTISFNNCGSSVVSVKIIDNDVISEDRKTFSIKLTINTPQVKTDINTAEVYIISDDHEKIVFELEGNYSLTAVDTNNKSVASEAGEVEIVQDESDPNRYWIKNASYLMELEGKAAKFPLCLNPEGMYFLVDSDGSMLLPSQSLGEYEDDIDAKSISIDLNEMTFSTAAISITNVGNKLIFGPNALGCAGLDEEGEILNLYYILSNLTLTKVTE